MDTFMWFPSNKLLTTTQHSCVSNHYITWRVCLSVQITYRHFTVVYTTTGTRSTTVTFTSINKMYIVTFIPSSLLLACIYVYITFFLRKRAHFMINLEIYLHLMYVICWEKIPKDFYYNYKKKGFLVTLLLMTHVTSVSKSLHALTLLEKVWA